MAGQDMGQWGSSNWANNYNMTGQPAASTPSASGTDPFNTGPTASGAAGPLGNGQQNNASFIDPASMGIPTLGAGGGGGGDSASPGANNSQWAGYTPYYNYDTMQPIPITPGRGAATNNTWNGAASDSDPWSAYGLDEGGVVPDGDSDVTGPVTDPSQAVSSVQKALAAGRQSMGIPASLFGAAAADDGDDDGDQDGDVAGNIPARPAAPGGDTPDQNPFPTKAPATPFGKRLSANVPARPAGPGGEGEDSNPFQTKTAPNPFGKRKQVPGAAAGGVIDDGDMDDPSAEGTPPQPTDNQPTGSGAGAVNMQALKQYAMGAGAMPADQAMALEQQADPQGQMDPALRKLLAVANAGSPQAQFGLLQHYRQRFNLLNAYAQAAAKGGQGRPADLAESTQAATRAMSNVPTGHSISFQPAGNGVAVNLKKLGGSQRSYDDGGPVQEDDPESAATLATPDTSGVVDTGDPLASAMVESEGAQDGGMGTQIGSALQSAGKFVMSIPQYLNFLQQGNYDSLHDKGPEKVAQDAAQPPAASQPTQEVVPTGPQTRGDAIVAPNNPFVQAANGQKPTPPAAVQYTPAKPQVKHTPGGYQQYGSYDPALVDRAADAYGWGSPQFRQALEQYTSAAAGNTQKLREEQMRIDANAKLFGARNDGQNYRAQLRANVMTGNSREAVAARAQYAQLTTLSREIDSLRNLGAQDDDQRLAPLLQQQQLLMRALAPMMEQPQQPQSPQPRQSPQPGQQSGQQAQAPVPGAKFYQGQWYVRGANGEAVPYQGQ